MYHVFFYIYFNLGNVSSCIDMYLGIFVNRIEIEYSYFLPNRSFIDNSNLRAKKLTCINRKANYYILFHCTYLY